MGGSCGGLRLCNSVSEGSCGRERRTVGSVRRESGCRTGCTSAAGAGAGADTDAKPKAGAKKSKNQEGES